MYFCLLYTSQLYFRYDQYLSNHLWGDSFKIAKAFTNPYSLVTYENVMENEIQRRLVLANKAYFSLERKFESKLLTRGKRASHKRHWLSQCHCMHRRSIGTIYTIAVYTMCAIYTRGRSAKNALGTFERKIMTRIFESVK